MLNPRMNHCLAQLDEGEYSRIEAELRLVSLTQGQLLYEAGDPIRKFLFPVTAKIAISASLDGDHYTDIVLIGAEGMLGRRLLIDGISSHRAYVSVAGFAYEISALPILHEFRKFSGVHDICMASIENILMTISKEVLCSRFHSLEQRLAKWLLQRLDEGSGNSVETTHQSIASSLGYKREAITLNLRHLEGVELFRGKIEVKDRSRLERAACSCYAPPDKQIQTQLNIWAS